jgi:hypothetical protein
MTQHVAANCAKDERQENLRPQLPAAQQDKTAGRTKLPHRRLQKTGKTAGVNLSKDRKHNFCPAHCGGVFICADTHGSPFSISSQANGAYAAPR